MKLNTNKSPTYIVQHPRLPSMPPSYTRESDFWQPRLHSPLRCREFGAKMRWLFEEEQLEAPHCIHQFTHNSSWCRPGPFSSLETVFYLRICRMFKNPSVQILDYPFQKSTSAFPKQLLFGVFTPWVKVKWGKYAVGTPWSEESLRKLMV